MTQKLFIFILDALVLASSVSGFSAAPPQSQRNSGTILEDKIQDCIALVRKQHEAEYQSSSKIFASCDIECEQKIWSDEDFISHSVGVGNGGPSEKILCNGHIIFETAQPVLNDTECDYYIKMAQETIEREREEQRRQLEFQQSQNPSDQRDWQTTNSDLGEARLSSLPSEALDALRLLLQQKLYPLLTERFGIHDLKVYDGLILGSIAPSISQPVHRDASLLTLNIALSSPDKFTNGGTYIEGLEDHDGTPLCIGRGKILAHSSGIMHAGNAIDSGERWVLVLFCISKNEAQIARRTHAAGLDAIDVRQLDDAKIAFQAGLTDAPGDHLLHMGIGQVASMRGEKQTAFDCLVKAEECYPTSHRAGITMGKMLLADRKPRAALRRFDRVLARINNEDLQQGAWMPLKAQAWDARVSAARCSLMCAEYEARNKSGDKRGWSEERLPEAIDRLHAALIPAPNDASLLEMLSRAEELLASIDS